MTSEVPCVGEFEYKISIGVWLPRPHAEMLHTTALHHYDSVVRASACAGAINGLRNRAIVAAEYPDDSPGPSYLEFREIDTALKALEQAISPGTDGARLVRETRSTLLDAIARINARSRELHDSAAEFSRGKTEREALLRLVKEWPRRTAVLDMDHSRAATDATWRVVQEHPDGQSTTVWVRGSSLGEALEATRYILPYFPEESFAP